MTLFEQYMEAIKYGDAINDKQASTKETYFSAKPGDVFKVVRPQTRHQKASTSKMKIEKITDHDVFYTWTDSAGKETKGKVSKRVFYHDIESGEAKKITSEDVYSEGENVKFTDLPEDAQKALSAHKSKPVWKGIHGFVVDPGKATLDKKKLDAITALKGFRFIRLTMNGKDLNKAALDKLIQKTGYINIDGGSIHI